MRVEPMSPICLTVQPLLRVGDRGPEVLEMRKLLAQSDRGFGFAGITVGDTFTSTIETIVKTFQKQVFLAQDGIVGAKTWAALCANSPVQMPTIRRGDRGEAVRQAQAALQQLQLYTAGLDGDFGPLTHQAVLTFQAQSGLVSDGIIGQLTWDQLGRRLG